MGREANCICEVNGQSARVKALIESPELILRGEIRQRIPLAKITDLKTDGPFLQFKFGAEKFALALGAETASKWVQTLRKPAPTLAAKLGITSDSTIMTIGKVDDEVLRSALSEGQITPHGNVDVIVACVNTRAELESAFERSLKLVLDGTSLWIVYRKGKGHAINESDVRETGLAAGIVDVKIAAVSGLLTGLKFLRRRTAGKS